MIAKTFICFFILFLISFSSAADLGVSPREINFEMNLGEINCQNFYLIGEKDFIFVGEDYWNLAFEENIQEYKKYDVEVGLTVDYNEVTRTGKREICISGNKKGEYFGVLLYQVAGKNYGIGTWLKVQIKDEKASFMKKGIEDFSKTNFYLSFLVFLLFGIFITLLFSLVKVVKKNS